MLVPTDYEIREAENGEQRSQRIAKERSSWPEDIDRSFWIVEGFRTDPSGSVAGGYAHPRQKQLTVFRPSQMHNAWQD